MAQARVPVFYDISRYLPDKYFGEVRGCHPPGDPPNGPPRKQFFERLSLGCQSVLISTDIQKTNILT